LEIIVPIAEYMLHRIPEGKTTPPFIRNGGHWWNPNDYTLVGWIEENVDYYIPETIVYLSKEAFAQRALSMHQNVPFIKKDPSRDPAEPDNAENTIPMSDEEVVELANNWYDEYLQQNTGN
jgi:hypothetical protein